MICYQGSASTNCRPPLISQARKTRRGICREDEFELIGSKSLPRERHSYPVAVRMIAAAADPLVIPKFANSAVFSWSQHFWIERVAGELARQQL